MFLSTARAARPAQPADTYLLPLHVHVPDDDPTVAATGDELPRVLRVAKGLDSVTAKDTTDQGQQVKPLRREAPRADRCPGSAPSPGPRPRESDGTVDDLTARRVPPILSKSSAHWRC